MNGPRYGVSRYTEYLIKHWGTMLGSSDAITLYTHSPLHDDFTSCKVPITNKVVRPKLTNALWENLLLSGVTKDIDVLFGPSYTLPLKYQGKSVVSIHSLNEAVDGVHSLLYKLTYSQKYRLSAVRADKVITNSYSTKERIIDYYRIPEDKVEVIWLGADEAFQPIHDDALTRHTRVSCVGTDCPYIIFVGSLSERRNIPMLIKAFSLLKRREGIPHSLLLVGANPGHLPVHDLAKQFGISESVIHMEGKFTHHSELAAIYNAADLFVMPSSSEGFSLTLAEAMSCGLPVITSNKSALGEVANGYALTLDELTEDTLTDAMSKVLNDSELNKKLRIGSLERAQSLRWRHTARKTLSILQAVSDS